VDPLNIVSSCPCCSSFSVPGEICFSISGCWTVQSAQVWKTKSSRPCLGRSADAAAVPDSTFFLASDAVASGFARLTNLRTENRFLRRVGTSRGVPRFWTHGVADLRHIAIERTVLFPASLTGVPVGWPIHVPLLERANRAKRSCNWCFSAAFLVPTGCLILLRLGMFMSALRSISNGVQPLPARMIRGEALTTAARIGRFRSLE